MSSSTTSNSSRLVDELALLRDRGPRAEALDRKRDRRSGHPRCSSPRTILRMTRDPSASSRGRSGLQFTARTEAPVSATIAARLAVVVVLPSSGPEDVTMTTRPRGARLTVRLDPAPRQAAGHTNAPPGRPRPHGIAADLPRSRWPTVAQGASSGNLRQHGRGERLLHLEPGAPPSAGLRRPRDQGRSSSPRNRRAHRARTSCRQTRPSRTAAQMTGPGRPGGGSRPPRSRPPTLRSRLRRSGSPALRRRS